MRDQEIVGLYEAYQSIYSNVNEEVEQLDEFMKHQKEREGIESRKKMRSYSPPTKGKHGEIERRKAKNPPSRLRSGSLPVSNQAEEVEAWINALVEEGYDLSGYTWEAMCEMYMNEVGQLDEAENPITSGGKRLGKFLSNLAPTLDGALKGGGESIERATRGAIRVNRVPNPTAGPVREETDLFDYILEYLVAEGYADTNEAAITIMANMSEEWKQSIVEADSIEAMRARAAKRRKQRYGASDTSRGGRDDFKPITDYEEADKKWKRPGKPDKG